MWARVLIDVFAETRLQTGQCCDPQCACFQETRTVSLALETFTTSGRTIRTHCVAPAAAGCRTLEQSGFRYKVVQEQKGKLKS